MSVHRDFGQKIENAIVRVREGTGADQASVRSTRKDQGGDDGFPCRGSDFAGKGHAFDGSFGLNCYFRLVAN